MKGSRQWRGEAELSAATLEQHHMILHGALEAAVESNYIGRNVASTLKGRPKSPGVYALQIGPVMTVISSER